MLASVGWYLWPARPAPIPLHLVAGTVQADLLTADQASRATGITLIQGPRAATPAPALTADPASCGIAVGPTSQAVYGNDWTAFRTATYTDTEGIGDFTMTQTIAVYPESGKANAVLQILTTGLRSCPSAARTAPGGQSSKWTYRIDGATASSIAWTATQDGGGGWTCYRQAQVKGRALVQVGICEAGNGRPTVTSLLALIKGKVSA